ncbi:retrovirus-related pol polyprotein from transposon TNT 1-94 [Tanacetum coccineum]
MGDENHIRTLGDYSKPSHEGYRNTIELLEGNNAVPLRSDTIRLVQNRCSFHGLRSEDPNQHLKDFLKLLDSFDLNGDNKERMRLRLFQFSFRDQASNWLERLPVGSISTWDYLTTGFLAQFFPPVRTAKLRNDILMFQQHQGESLSEAWTCFKDLLQKVPHHGIDRWLLIQIFYDHVSFHLKCEIDRAATGKLRDKNANESWEIIKNLALYNHERWNDSKDFAKPVKPIFTSQSTSKTPDRRLLELEDHINFFLKGPRPTPRPSSTHVPQAYAEAVSSTPYHEIKISVIREEEEKNVVNNRAIVESIVEPSKSEEEEPLKEASVMNEVERRADNEPSKSVSEHVTKNEEEEPARLKALDEMFLYKTMLESFLGLLRPKWRAKVMVIEESKDLSSLALDEFIGNLKVHEVVMEKDSEIYRGKKERVKSIALKAKKESSDDETSTIEYCPKPLRNKDQKAFIEVLGAIAKITPRTKLTMKRVSWLNHQMTSLLTLLIIVCLRTCLEPDEWIKDSGCSKHMTGNKSLFSTYKAYDGGNVVFGSNLKGKIIGKGTISNDSLTISNVEHVDNLAFNLLSVSQICDNKCRVLFTEEGSEIIKDGKIIGNRIRKNGLYVMKLGNKSQDKLCLATVVDNSTLWHRRLGHANMRLIQSLSSKELVRNLPKLKYDKYFCDACKIGKQAHASHKAKNMVSTKRCLELLHMDLFGPSAIKSYGGNLYTLVVVDDYSRYTWTRFLKTKNEAFEKFEILSRKIQNQLGSSIVAIRTDHGREFDNEVQFGAYCDAQGITHNFSAPRTPQSNGVVERKNRTLQEMSRTMLNEQSIPQKFWCNVVDTSTYILNRILIRPILGKTPYEIFRGRKPSLEYFKVFGSKCFVLNTKDYLTKFDPKSYEGVFLGYSQNSKAYIVLNKHKMKVILPGISPLPKKHKMKVKESLNMTFNESPPPTKLSPLVDDDIGEEEGIRNNTKVVNNNNEEDESIEVDKVVNIKRSKNHPLDQIIGNIN